MRTIASLVFGLHVSLALPSIADAEQLSGTRKPKAENDYCLSGATDVAQWSPAQGPLASHVAEALVTKNGFIALGYDARGFWSAETDPGADAGGGGTYFLRHTSFTGERLSTYQLGGGEGETDADRAEQRDVIEQLIYAVPRFDVTALRHDYKLTLPKHDEEGRIEKFSGWFAEIKKQDGAVLRFALVATPFMCWCDSRWVAYTLAAPKKSASTSGGTK